jgi:hypothetical protein
MREDEQMSVSPWKYAIFPSKAAINILAENEH